MPAENTKRIAKNTIALYIRMLLTMAVSLYTSRVILNVLGVDDFGIYNVVGGVVALFSIINASMTSSVQRFTSYELGQNNAGRINIVFNISLAIHGIIAIIFGILALGIGLWFIYYQLNIPPDRLTASVWVLGSSVLSSMMCILLVPYNASIIAHEHMTIYAYTGILDSVLKLVIVYVLLIFPYDKLIVFSVLLSIASAIPVAITIIYCRRKFSECFFKRKFDKELFRKMTKFAGWSFFSTAAATGYSQGINIILNIFFGVVINAARGIAFQVSAAITRFARNFQIALNPQIIKSYAAGEIEYMHSLIYRGAKFSFIMMLMLSLPILICTQYILTLWLITVPDYTAIFCQLVLIDAMIGCISNPLTVAAEASGRIAKFQCWTSILSLCNLPAAYLLLRFGYSPQSTMYASIVLQCVTLLIRMYILRNLIDMPMGRFFRYVLLRLMAISGFAVAVTYLFSRLFTTHNFLILIAISCFSTLSIAASSYLFGFNTSERAAINQYFIRFARKLKTAFAH